MTTFYTVNITDKELHYNSNITYYVISRNIPNIKLNVITTTIEIKTTGTPVLVGCSTV